MLDQSAIAKQIEQNAIRISPFDSRNFKESSYTFSLGDRALKVCTSDHVVSAKLADQRIEEFSISEDGIEIKPGEFWLLETNEVLAISDHISCMLSARGSVAKIGLSALIGSHFAEPGTNQKLVLEVVNQSPNTILLEKGLPIVKGIFFKCHAEPENFNLASTFRYIADPNRIWRTSIQRILRWAK